jgi:branched-chain amino acid transport system substrate-binding protein
MRPDIRIGSFGRQYRSIRLKESGRGWGATMLRIRLNIFREVCGFQRRSGKQLVLLFSTLCLAAGGVIAAWSASSRASDPVTLKILHVAPFSGQFAVYGQGTLAFAKIAQDEINHAGGVLGDKIAVQTVDDVGDPSDGAVALRRALTSTQNVVGVSGLLTLGGSTEIPLAVAAHKIALGLDGSTAYIFSKKTLGAGAKYLYNVSAPDALQGYAMGVAVRRLHYRHPAIVFTTSPDSVPVFQGVTSALHKLGIKPAISLTLATSASSYGTEVQRLLAAHPDSMVFELDPQTAGTFLSNLSAAQGGNINLPMISDTESTIKEWLASVSNTPGVLAALQREMHMVQPPVGSLKKNPELAYMRRVFTRYTSQSSFGIPAMALHDAVLLMALAMDKAHSTNPSVFGPYMYTLGSASFARRSKATAYTYAQGLHDIATGKRFVFAGAMGPFNWTPTHVAVNPETISGWAPAAGGVANPAPPFITIPAGQMISALG